jgi:hypothetical protein
MKLLLFSMMVFFNFYSLQALAQEGSARQAIEQALRQARQSPVTASTSDLQAEFAEREHLINWGIKEIAKLEQQMLAKKSVAESTGRDALSFMQEYSELANQLPQELKALIQAKPGFRIDQDLPEHLKGHPAVVQVEEYINKAMELSNSFIQDLDRYTQDSLDLGMLIGLQEARKEIEKFRTSNADNPSSLEVRSQTLARLEAYSATMEENIKSFLDNKHQYGQANDAYRTAPYGKFYTAVSNIFKKVSPTSGSERSPREKIKLSFLQRMANLVLTLKLAWNGARLSAAIFFNSKPSTDGVSKITQSINAAARVIAKKNGQQVTVTGKENRPTLSEDGKDIYIIAPSHRHRPSRYG